MGRGLSSLQKRILLLALENRKAEERSADQGGADVYYAEIMAAVYGFEPLPGSMRWGPNHEKVTGQRRAGGCKFHKNLLGRRYNAASSAISRAVTRLYKRGLVQPVMGSCSHWSGATLTETGMAAARLLTATREGGDDGE